MKISGVPFYPAHPKNFTKGRIRPITHFTVHHSAGWEATLRYLWGDPNRNASSHFWVGNSPGQIEQYVDTDDTAWTNTDWLSNNESITVEVRGDWRGYYDQTTLDNLGTLLEMVRRAYPSITLTYHMDVSDKVTLCPADLKHKGYAQQVWDKVTDKLNPPNTPAPNPTINYELITPKRVELVRAANLWNFNFTDWSKAQSIESYGAGQLIDVVAVATNALGGKYYMTAYSYNNGSIRATNGFNVADCIDYIAPTPIPVMPTWEALDNPRKLRAAVDLYVIDLDSKQPQGAQIAKGTDIDFVDKINSDQMYLRSKWAHDNSKNWGVPMSQLEEINSETPQEPIPQPPIDTDPTTPGNSDVTVKLNWLERAIRAILEFFGIKLDK